MVRSWTTRVEAASDADLAAVVDEVLVLEVDGRLRTGVPADVGPQVREALGRTGAAPLDPWWWRAVLGRRVVEVIGPSALLLAARTPDVAVAPHVEQVARWRLTRLREAVAPAEWDAAGFAADPAVTVARFSEPLEPPAWMARATPAARRTVVSSAACLGGWAGHPSDVGVLTHPGYRGRGHGTEVAGVVVAQAVREGGFARWRVDERDAGSLAIARRLGFEAWGRLLRVRLRA